MLFPVSFRRCRRLALFLVIAALLATLAVPLHASSAQGAAPTGPVLGLLDWFQDLVQRLGMGPVAGAEEPEAPSAVFLPDSGCMDPDGVPTTCSREQSSHPAPVALSSAPEPRSGRRIQ